MRFSLIVCAIASILALTGCSQVPPAIPPQQLQVAGESLAIVGYLNLGSGRMYVEAALPTDSQYVIHSMLVTGPQEMTYPPDRWRDLGLHPLPAQGEAYAGDEARCTQPSCGRYIQASWDTRYSLFSPPVGKLYVNMLCTTCNNIAVRRLSFTMEALAPLNGDNRSRVIFTPAETASPQPVAAIPQADAPPPGRP